MAQWADASSSTATTEIEHSSVDVGLADFDPNYDPSYDLEANCPMCRTHTTASPDTELAKQLETKYPATYAERRVEEEIDRGSRIGHNGVEGFMILIGNRHKLIRGTEDANQHDWTFFVRTSRPDLVKEVRINLVSRPNLRCKGMAHTTIAPHVPASTSHHPTPTIRGQPSGLGYVHARSYNCATRVTHLGQQQQRRETIRS